MTNGGDASRTVLRRVLGGTTALCTGVGVAIGTGIFRTPSDIARQLASTEWILFAWVCGGLFTLVAGLVTAELATRFPRAGGEYVYLREAYGDFAAFFFGWAYTVFGIGGGAGVIAAALGEAACDVVGIARQAAPLLGVGAIVLVTLINCVGVHAGAGTQTLLTVLKVLALLAMTVFALLWPLPAPTGGVSTPAPAATGASPTLEAFAAAFVGVLWSYSGATDSARLAEEVKDVHRALPRALLGSAALLTAVYLLINVAFLRVMSPAEMATSTFVGNDIMSRLVGPMGGRLLAVATVVICLGTLASNILSSVRITFALARDGLAPARLGRMSAGQAPIDALMLAGLIASLFVFNRGFSAVLAIYTLATALLFSLSYASLLIFRRRDREPVSQVFRCPAAALCVAGLIAVEIWISYGLVREFGRDALWTVALMVAIAGLYWPWRALGARQTSGHTGDSIT